ncbi:MAG TPA: Mur ligase family protein [Propionibacteriaceae bacterium]|nr:Mur ligase family protein [Propionibacteriaceae bacterium]
MVRDLDSALDALLHFSGRRTRGHSSVDTLRALLDHLGNPERSYRVVHIAGTSGKTSTAYLIRGLLEAAGFRTGLTVSPHVVAVNERVQVGGVPVPEERFVAYVNEFLPLATALGRELTYFELGVGLALWVFAREGVEYAIVEVGIGGTRDATNALQSPDKLCVVSAIGLDHTELLGDSLNEIAAHKAGIVGEGNTVVVVDQDEAVLDVVRERAREVGGRVVVAVPPEGSPYQERNLALARASVAELAQRDGFAMPEVAVTETPPGRYERFACAGRRLVLDGAHNPQKVAALVAALKSDGLTGVAAMATLLQAPDTKLTATLSLLAPAVTYLVVPEYELGDGDKVKRSFPADVVAQEARALGIETEIVRSPADGLERLQERPERDLLVTGSLYLASLVRPYVRAWWGSPVTSF